MTDLLQLTADGWFEIRKGWAASFRGIPGFDPLPLRGQQVVIDGKEYTVHGVQWGLTPGRAGKPFTLLVGER
jgi:hypothetical protein